MTGMFYCHLCRASAFVKSRLDRVVTLDCGHVVAVKPKPLTSEEVRHGSRGTRPGNETVPPDRHEASGGPTQPRVQRVPEVRRDVPQPAATPAKEAPRHAFDASSVAKRVSDLLKKG